MFAGFGLKVGKKQKSVFFYLLLLVDWLLGKWLSALSESKRTWFLGKNLFFFQIEVVVLGEILGCTTTSILTLPEGSCAPKDSASQLEVVEQRKKYLFYYYLCQFGFA